MLLLVDFSIRIWFCGWWANQGGSQYKIPTKQPSKPNVHHKMCECFWPLLIFYLALLLMNRIVSSNDIIAISFGATSTFLGIFALIVMWKSNHRHGKSQVHLCRSPNWHSPVGHEFIRGQEEIIMEERRWQRRYIAGWIKSGKSNTRLIGMGFWSLKNGCVRIALGVKGDSSTERRYWIIHTMAQHF